MTSEPSRARLGLGLAAIGRPAYITVGRDADLGAGETRSVEALRERAHRLLDEAWRLGIRYIDAARSYGLAEQFLGSWLAEHPHRRAELTLGSKWGYEYVGDWQLNAETQERKQHSLRMLDEQWPQTLEALGTVPDVYLIHSLTPVSPALGDAALLDRLRELAASGVRIGFSTSGPSQGAIIRAALALPDAPFSAVQTTYNLLEPSAAPALTEAHDAGWLVVVKEALANGRLVSLMAEALGVAVRQPWADIVLSGAVTPAQLRENLEAAAAPSALSPAPPPAPPSAPLDPDADAPLELDALAAFAALAEDPAQYWAARSARPWR
ncbi:aldo/keto reductase [Subtercola endophyticus]|uniref:aldo/keto reductase n=1 Tax=Subtercola endophyticus TaxID=2895559 RepID=UPI001E2D709D|nr:aldo/keto reductase [Subtercola endophyticus]UFS57509.1 aldo/keto reductase [Subtercola endophyticus]